MNPLFIPPESDPIQLRQEAPRNPGFLGRFVRSLKRFDARRSPPYERRILEGQLRDREYFPQEAWAATNLSPAFVDEVLRILKEELYWPNANFLPDDPLFFCLISDYDDVPWFWFFSRINRYFKIKFDDNDIKRIRNEGWILRGLLEEIAARRDLLYKNDSP